MPSRHQRLELLDPESAKHCPPHPGCKPERIDCVASAEWPTLFYGVIAGHDRRLDPDCDVHLGSLRFPADGSLVRRVYLVARYRRPERVPACLGLVPSDHSSRASMHRGGIIAGGGTAARHRRGGRH